MMRPKNLRLMAIDSRLDTEHNRTVERGASVIPEAVTLRAPQTRMNNVSAFDVPGQEVSSAQPDLQDVHPGKLEELVHELRQPLSVIESLAYYLEMTVADKNSCNHLQRIRVMLRKTHAILEQARESTGTESVLASRARSLLQEH